MFEILLHNVLDSVATEGLDEQEASVLRACLEAWLGQASGVGEPTWVEGRAIAIAASRAAAEDIGRKRVEQAIRRLAQVQATANGERLAAGPLLEVPGFRRVDGEPAAWRVRPGPALRARLRAQLARATQELDTTS